MPVWLGLLKILAFTMGGYSYRGAGNEVLDENEINRK